MRVRGRTKLVLGAVLALAVCALTASAGTRHRCECSAVETGSEGRNRNAADRGVHSVGLERRDERGVRHRERGGPGGIRRHDQPLVRRRRRCRPSSGKKAKSNPQFVTGFEGLNFYQQRYARGGNQFSVEPPDQGMCVGNGYVVEAVNDVFNVYNTSGQSVLPDNTATNIVGGFPRNVNHAVDLNSFYGYPPAINRSTGHPRPVRHRPELHLRRGHPAVLPRRAHARDGPDDRRVHAGEPPRPRGQPDGQSDRRLEHLPASTSPTTAPTRAA